MEIEFLEWVHPRLGITPVQVEGGKPLRLKARIVDEPKKEWVGLTPEERHSIAYITNTNTVRAVEMTETLLAAKNV